MAREDSYRRRVQLLLTQINVLPWIATRWGRASLGKERDIPSIKSDRKVEDLNAMRFKFVFGDGARTDYGENA